MTVLKRRNSFFPSYIFLSSPPTYISSFSLIRHQIPKEKEVQTPSYSSCLNKIHVPGSLVAANCFFFKNCKIKKKKKVCEHKRDWCRVRGNKGQKKRKSPPEPWRSLFYHRPTDFPCLGGKTLTKIIFLLGQTKCWKEIYFVSSSHIGCEELLLPSSLKPIVMSVRQDCGRLNIKKGLKHSRPDFS